MKTYGGHNRQKGHSDSGVLICIVSKNDRGNNNDDEEDYQLYGICEKNISLYTLYCILTVWELYPSMYDCILNTIKIHKLHPFCTGQIKNVGS